MIETLFDFQREDVEYLRSQAAVGIWNEMGTGKTYEAIARDQIIRGERGAGATLVVAPATPLETTWKAKLEELTTCKVTLIDRKDRQRSWDLFKKRGGFFLIHWEALRLMPKDFFEYPWQHIIADEAHRAKNRKAQQTRALKAIKSTYRTAMTGTPIGNRPDEMWSVLNWLRPNQYRSYWKFVNKYVEISTKQGRGHMYREILGPKNVMELQEELKPFTIRRRKMEVLKDLPEKYYSEMRVDLDPQQRRIYKQMEKDMIAWIGDQEQEVLPAPVVIAQLTRLQQFACAYAEIDPETGKVRLREPSSKLDAAMEVLDEAGDGQVVFFSRFKQLATLLARRLTAAGISHVAITGSTPPEERPSAVREFQTGRARVCIGTIRAGGEGIDLFAASTVVFLDRDWSPIYNGQAEDRLHRIGQKNAVQVIDVIARNTVDRGRMQRLELKKSWIRTMLGDPT
jgi:SNF2 family DNA or RNA helicase